MRTHASMAYELVGCRLSHIRSRRGSFCLLHALLHALRLRIPESFFLLSLGLD